MHRATRHVACTANVKQRHEVRLSLSGDRDLDQAKMLTGDAVQFLVSRKLVCCEQRQYIINEQHVLTMLASIFETPSVTLYWPK